MKILFIFFRFLASNQTVISQRKEENSTVNWFCRVKSSNNSSLNLQLTTISTKEWKNFVQIFRCNSRLLYIDDLTRELQYEKWINSKKYSKKDYFFQYFRYDNQNSYNYNCNCKCHGNCQCNKYKYDNKLQPPEWLLYCPFISIKNSEKDIQRKKQTFYDSNFVDILLKLPVPIHSDIFDSMK